MDIGVGGIADIGDIESAVAAERLGFRDFWVGDNPIMWSDCYATLALIAQATSTIRIGPGVAVSGTRSPEVTAGAMATINRLAPGRTCCGVGSGNTAMRALGLPPMRVSDFDRWLAELRPLLAGDEATLRRAGREVLARHLAPDRGLVRFTPRIPLLVSGYGPRAIGLAARYGDGLVGIGMAPEDVERAWGIIESEAARAGRAIDRDAFLTAVITTIVVLQDGEPRDSDRVKRQVGAYAITVLHQAYEEYRLMHREPPSFVHSVWDDYVEQVERVEEERRHQRIHAGHAFWVLEEEERFVTRELIDATSFVGTAGEVASRLRELQDAGLSEVVIIPPPEVKREVMREVADHIMPLLAG
jgi:5,10-methylenetetrahydromethanopterin reductase